MNRSQWAERSGRSSSWIRPIRRWSIYARDNFDCVYCKLVFPLGSEQLTLDHVVPRRLGGSTESTNLVTCCWGCNVSRQDRKLTFNELRKVNVAVAKPVSREAGIWHLGRHKAKLPWQPYQAQLLLSPQHA